MQLLNLKFSTASFMPFQMVTLIWWSNFSRLVMTRGVPHLLEICHTYYAIESVAAAMCAGKTINAAQKSCQPWKQLQKHPSQCWELHMPAPSRMVTMALLKSLSAKVVWRKDIVKLSVIPATTTNPLLQWTTNQKVHMVNVEGREEGWPCSSPHWGTTMGWDFLYDVCAPPTNDAHTTVPLLAYASNKGMASLWVKVDNGASGNVLPLHLFRHLYPTCNDKTGHPTGLNMSNTRLTVYNGTWIPLFGSLDGPIIWQPESPSKQPCQINSCCYEADTPGPAILGLPSCKRFEVIKIKINCAVKSSKTIPGCLVPLQHHQHPRKQLQSSLQRTSSKSSQA